jgi:hypothetical protein
MHRKDGKGVWTFLSEGLKGKDHLGNRGVDGSSVADRSVRGKELSVCKLAS